MDKHHKRRSIWTLALAAAASLALAACGGSGDAGTLLKQTFSGAHKVNSGQLQFAVRVQPSGSSTLRGPISLSFGGPFQSLGTGKLPQSDFNLNLSAMGSAATLGILSTGTNGYVSFEGSNYQLPQAAYQRLEQSFASVASSSGGSSRSSILNKLGIQPLHWLNNPQVVGSQSVGGTPTTHIRAGINLAALLNDFNTFLARASSLGISGSSSFPHGLSQASINRIAGEIHNPRFDLWTGQSDHTLRRLQIHLALPVSGQLSTLLGGLRSAGLLLSMQYTHLNQPQTITAPTSVAPFSQFQSRLRTFLSALESGVTGALSGGASGGSSSGGGSSGSIQAYSQCIQAAGGNVSKMQQCASLLGK
jgi:hypothetical protein